MPLHFSSDGMMIGTQATETTGNEMTRTEKRDFRKWERQCGHGWGDRLLDWITRVSPEGAQQQYRTEATGEHA
jgi:hypothetical protein